MILRGVLLLAASVNTFSQESLKNALALTESQVWLIQQKKPKPARIDAHGPANLPKPYSESLLEALQNPILDASQQAKLAEIVKVLDRWKMASEAIAAGLIDAGQWPGYTLCFFSLRAFPEELGLSELQVSRLEELQRIAQAPEWAQIREKAMRRDEFLNSGLRKDSAEVIQLNSDISKLSKLLATTKPARNLTLGVLDEVQKAKLAAFEIDLKLTGEAIQFKLIPAIQKGEILCP